MILQIASYLLHKGFSIDINHHDDLLQNAMSQRAIEAPYHERKPWWNFWD